MAPPRGFLVAFSKSGYQKRSIHCWASKGASEFISRTLFPLLPRFATPWMRFRRILRKHMSAKIDPQIVFGEQSFAVGLQ
jgi:hypothetical protein